ncbi:hypothetical protein Barb4_04917 [Bacteroidales bacterium Barb4]|nr:hypothetical protein Barb4_04917 [Bacteroidales bacterium Barb4]
MLRTFRRNVRFQPHMERSGMWGYGMGDPMKS